MKLNRLFKDATPIEIKELMTDSRVELKKSLFYCLKGMVHDGHAFIHQAISNGAIAIVYSDPIEFIEGIEYIKVDNVINELNRSADIFYKHPSQKLNMIGVTGTNGKSTIAKTIKELYSLWNPCGYSGTISIEYGDHKEKPDFTTDETVPTLKMLNRMLNADMKAVALEVSSQGLDQHRVDALRFDIAIFTNLTHDHLDYHGNLENYFQAKKRLFSLLKPKGCSIVNIDDPYGARLFNEIYTRKYSFSIYENADYQAKNIELGALSTKFTLVVEEKEYNLETNFVSEFNLSNLLAVIAALHQSGFSIDQISEHLNHLPQVDGRMEVIQEGQNFNVIVDYAHTPDGFEKIYQFAKSITSENNKIISVFGSAGKRDCKKRPILGSISDKYCQMIILTEEDPRNESALNIAQEIAAGIKQNNYIIVLDRYDAIQQALELANKNDTVLILAKGNERYITRQFGKEYWMGDESATIDILKKTIVQEEEQNEL
jgi:UDP-N-acetylmuramoyl-L-alanyl-D-glutamate--2,6-diaminopimelate ligase